MLPKIGNLAENLIIVIVVGLLCGGLGGGTGYFAAVNSHKLTVAQLKPVIEKAIDKESIKNEISNEIRIGKIKKSDSLMINLVPANTQKAVATFKEEQGPCVDISALSDSRQRRIARWLAN